MKARRFFRYFLFNKPYGVLCQFSPSPGKRTLADFGPFPKEMYPVGRLDFDSEGLVLLTNDGGLQHALSDPRFRHPRMYLAQVERIPDTEALQRLAEGIVIDQKRTLPAEVRLLTSPPELPPRPVPIRFRKNVPTSWLEIVIHEGRNRQVRKMTAAVGCPTLRLVRIKIGNLALGDLNPGEWRELSESEVRTG